MKHLVYLRSKRLEWRSLDEPRVVVGTDALVRPFSVARCDLETAFLRHDLSPWIRLGVACGCLAPRLLHDFGKRPFSGPLPVGHECIAEVMEVGPEVCTVDIGDVVVVPYQISCGTCERCQRGETGYCLRNHDRLNTFGGFAAGAPWGGTLSDLLRVPHADHMLVKFPESLDPIPYASASDNLVDGYRTVAPHLKRMAGAPVLVVGGRGRSIGLYAVCSAVALGSERVVYLDWDRERLELAEKLGAEVFLMERGVLSSKGLLSRFPVSVEASVTHRGLGCALAALETCGTCTISALHFAKKSPLPLWDMYSRNLRIITGMPAARVLLPEVLELALTGRLEAAKVVTRVASWEEAPEAMSEATTKVVVSRDRVIRKPSPTASTPSAPLERQNFLR